MHGQGASNINLTAPLYKPWCLPAFINQPPLLTMPGLVFSSFFCSENPNISARVWYEAFYQKSESNLMLLHDPLFLLRQTRVLTICFCFFVCLYFFKTDNRYGSGKSLFVPAYRRWAWSRSAGMDALPCWLGSVLPNKIFNVFIREGGLVYFPRFR